MVSRGKDNEFIVEWLLSGYPRQQPLGSVWCPTICMDEGIDGRGKLLMDKRVGMGYEHDRCAQLHPPEHHISGNRPMKPDDIRSVTVAVADGANNEVVFVVANVVK